MFNNVYLTIIAEEQITDKFQKLFFRLRKEYLNYLYRIRDYDEELYFVLKATYNLDEVNMPLPLDFCTRVARVASVVDSKNITNITVAYLKLRQQIKTERVLLNQDMQHALIDWMFWITNLFFSLATQKTNRSPIPPLMQKNNVVNNAIAECNAKYRGVMQQIKNVDAQTYMQLKSAFNPFSEYVPIGDDFVQNIRLVMAKINLDELQKCAQILEMQTVPIADDIEWEIVSAIFGFISCFYTMLQQAAPNAIPIAYKLEAVKRDGEFRFDAKGFYEREI